jgi:hypothetical protein
VHPAPHASDPTGEGMLCWLLKALIMPGHWILDIEDMALEQKSGRTLDKASRSQMRRSRGSGARF